MGSGINGNGSTPAQGGGGLSDVNNQINPTDVQQASDLKDAFEMSIFNMANGMMSQGNNALKDIFAKSNEVAQKRKQILAMIKQGLT